MYTAPSVRQARNDMMAITTVSALPAIEADGTIWAVLVWNRVGSREASRAGSNSSAAALLVYDIPHRAPWDW